jgi:hypothetical protein
MYGTTDHIFRTYGSELQISAACLLAYLVQ